MTSYELNQWKRLTAAFLGRCQEAIFSSEQKQAAARSPVTRRTPCNTLFYHHKAMSDSEQPAEEKPVAVEKKVIGKSGGRIQFYAFKVAFKEW